MRKADPNTPYRISVHATGKYQYADTQRLQMTKDGKEAYRHCHWGKFDPNTKVFLPNADFLLLPEEEKKKFIFPEDWDISKALPSQAAQPTQPLQAHEEGDTARGHEEDLPPQVLEEDSRPQAAQACEEDRLYGDIWLTEQIAKKIGLWDDLMTVFNGNEERVGAILTLAIFPYLTGFSFNRLLRWQRIVKAPTALPLTPPTYTKIFQSISTLHRDELFKLRAARLGENARCAIDSTTRSAYGDGLTDIKYGRSKDRPDLPQTIEVVVYSLSDHLPVYYRTFPGNIPDSRTFQIITQCLDEAGFKGIVLITDRGYQTTSNLENVIAAGRKLITAASTSKALVMDKLNTYGDFSYRPESMSTDSKHRLYYEQFEESYKVKMSKADREIEADKLKINVYLNPELRATELFSLDSKIEEEEQLLKSVLKAAEKAKAVKEGQPAEAEEKPAENPEELAGQCPHFKLAIKDKTLVSYKKDEEKIQRERQKLGFFSLITHGLDYAPVEALEKYRERDEQEKYFQQMKSQMGFRMQKCSAEETKTGRLFVLFVGLIISSHIRHIWKSTDLKEKFDSSLAILDEMRSIRAIKKKSGKAVKLTPFVGDQLEICKAFGVRVPKGCAPGERSKRVTENPRKTSRKSS